MRVGDVLLRINGQRAVGHAEATQLLRSTRGDLRLEISRSQRPIAAKTLQRYLRGLSARRATAVLRSDSARRDDGPAPSWPPQEVVTANQAVLDAADDRTTRYAAIEPVRSFRKERREATGNPRSQAWREHDDGQARRTQPCRRLLCPHTRHTRPARTAPHRTAPHRTAPHRTAPHCTAPHRTGARAGARARTRSAARGVGSRGGG